MVLRIFLLTTLLIVATVAVVAQADRTNSADWLRVRSDNGEFTIEVPKKNKHYGSKTGFMIGRSFGDPFVLDAMNMVNAYVDGTLVSIESYGAYEGALIALYERDAFNKSGIETTKTKNAGYTVRQIIKRTDEFYMVRRYFNSKDQIYILTAASRTGETPTMRRFLESVEFAPGKKLAEADKITPISSLPQDEPRVEILEDKPASTPKSPSAGSIDDTGLQKLVIVNKQPPGYTTTARQKGVSGNIRVRALFSEDGWISNLSLYETLDGGLLRQTLFAAIRIKFLPQQRNGKPETVSKTLEYSFAIY
ncbi:MAG: energy transducer TonB [Pyrinomonadaceae bacterium]|nr:energy transducer TonB [Pyrinomonadaceae bacterium]